MAALFGGVAAMLIGFITLGFWVNSFVVIIKGSLPILFILGGALATYLGVEEWRDNQGASTDTYGSDAEVARYKAEAEKYKAELEALKAGQTEVTPPEENQSES